MTSPSNSGQFESVANPPEEDRSLPKSWLIDWVSLSIAAFLPLNILIGNVTKWSSTMSSPSARWSIVLVAVIPLAIVAYLRFPKHVGLPKEVNLKLVEAGSAGILALILVTLVADGTTAEFGFQCASLATDSDTVDLESCVKVEAKESPELSTASGLIFAVGFLKYVSAFWEMLLWKQHTAEDKTAD